MKADIFACVLLSASVSAQQSAPVRLLGIPQGAVLRCRTLKFQDADPDAWPDVAPQESAFIHKLAVRRRFV
jgi:hypothetical protein